MAWLNPYEELIYLFKLVFLFSHNAIAFIVVGAFVL